MTSGNVYPVKGLISRLGLWTLWVFWGPGPGTIIVSIRFILISPSGTPPTFLSFFPLLLSPLFLYLFFRLTWTISPNFYAFKRVDTCTLFLMKTLLPAFSLCRSLLHITLLIFCTFLIYVKSSEKYSIITLFVEKKNKWSELLDGRDMQTLLCQYALHPTIYCLRGGCKFCFYI